MPQGYHSLSLHPLQTEFKGFRLPTISPTVCERILVLSIRRSGLALLSLHIKMKVITKFTITKCILYYRDGAHSRNIGVVLEK